MLPTGVQPHQCFLSWIFNAIDTFIWENRKFSLLRIPLKVSYFSAFANLILPLVGL